MNIGSWIWESESKSESDTTVPCLLNLSVLGYLAYYIVCFRFVPPDFLISWNFQFERDRGRCEESREEGDG